MKNKAMSEMTIKELEYSIGVCNDILRDVSLSYIERPEERDDEDTIIWAANTAARKKDLEWFLGYRTYAFNNNINKQCGGTTIKNCPVV